MNEVQAGSLDDFGQRLRAQHGNEVGNLPDDMLALLQTLDEIPYELHTGPEHQSEHTD